MRLRSLRSSARSAPPDACPTGPCLCDRWAHAPGRRPLGLAVSLVGKGDVKLLIEEPAALAALAIGVVVVCLGAVRSSATRE